MLKVLSSNYYMNHSRSIVSSYNLFYLFVCIIWVPLQQYYLHVDGAGRTIMLLSTMAVLLNFASLIKRNSVFHSTPFLLWTMLVFYSFINSMFKGFDSPYGTLEYIWNNFLMPYIFLLIAIIEFNNDRFFALKIILIAQLLYMLMGVMHMSSGNYDRLAAEELGNILPLTAACSFYVASLLYCYKKLRGNWILLCALLILVLYIILLTATRKALGIVVIILIGTVLQRINRFSVKTLFILFLSIVVFYVGIDYLLANTLIGERLLEESGKYDVQLSSIPVVNDFLMKLLGDRALLYQMAFDIFPQHPITGIGLNNFMNMAQSDYRMHSEYMVQLCENGIIGFSLLIVFYFLLYKGILNNRKVGDNNLIYLFGLFVVLFVNLTAWTYNMQYIMVIYAILISSIYSTFYNNENCHTLQ